MASMRANYTGVLLLKRPAVKRKVTRKQGTLRIHWGCGMRKTSVEATFVKHHEMAVWKWWGCGQARTSRNGVEGAEKMYIWKRGGARKDKEKSAWSSKPPPGAIPWVVKCKKKIPLKVRPWSGVHRTPCHPLTLEEESEILLAEAGLPSSREKNLGEGMKGKKHNRVAWLPWL